MVYKNRLPSAFSVWTKYDIDIRGLLYFPITNMWHISIMIPILIPGQMCFLAPCAPMYWPLSAGGLAGKYPKNWRNKKRKYRYPPKPTYIKCMCFQSVVLQCPTRQETETVIWLRFSQICVHLGYSDIHNRRYGFHYDLVIWLMVNVFKNLLTETDENKFSSIKMITLNEPSYFSWYIVN